MIIDLRTIKSYWLTCERDSAKQRWPKMELFLKETDIPAEKYCGKLTNPYTFGIRDAWLDILKNNSLPLALIEDDIETIPKNWDSVISSIPDSADALHYSSSLYSRVNGQTVVGGVKWSEFDDMWLKIENMLSFHFVIILTERYKEHLINLLEQFDGNGGVDDRMAEEMHKFNVYCTKRPPVFQADGHSDLYTKLSLTEF